MTRLLTPIPGIDAYGGLSPAGVRVHGARFACRYLSNFPAKNLTRQEAAALKDAAIGIVTVWEDGGSDALGGYALGRSHAEQHVAMARACGKKDGVGFYYFAVDFDTVGHPERTDAYFDGVTSVIPKTHCGPYGGIEVIAHQADRGFGALWQSLAWSGGRLDERAQIYQRALGSSVDYDQAWYADYGQWQWVAPPPPDPRHYGRFLQHPVKIGRHFYVEAEAVKEFDRLYPIRHDHPIEFSVIRHDCKILRDRIWAVAHEGQDAGEFNLPGHFNIAWRGWRWQELDHRYDLTEA